MSGRDVEGRIVGWMDSSGELGERLAGDWGSLSVGSITKPGM